MEIRNREKRVERTEYTPMSVPVEGEVKGTSGLSVRRGGYTSGNMFERPVVYESVSDGHRTKNPRGLVYGTCHGLRKPKRLTLTHLGRRPRGSDDDDEESDRDGLWVCARLRVYVAGGATRDRKDDSGEGREWVWT